MKTQKLTTTILEKIVSTGNGMVGVGVDNTKLQEAKEQCLNCEKQRFCVNWCKPLLEIFNGGD